MDGACSGRWLRGGLAVALALGACDPQDRVHESSEPARRAPPGAQFPGAGLGAAGWALSAGVASVTCDEPGPAPAGSQGPAPGATAARECYYDADHPDDPAAVMEWIVESATEGELVHARLTFNPRFVDNTYGENAIGWGAAAMMPGMPAAGMPGAGKPKPPMPGMPGMPAKPPMMMGPGGHGHTFKDLVGSDHAEFTLTDADGTVKLKFKADYLTESASAPSGYASLGVTGGEGKMLIGAADAVAAVSTSLDRDLNACGYEKYTVDSPATDDDYTANPEAPKWDYRVVYDVWVERSAFGDAGFGRAAVQFVHASPSKAGSATIDVTVGKCPPGWPPYCTKPEGCAPQPPRCGDEPDESCTAWPPCDGGMCGTDSGDGLPLF